MSSPALGPTQPPIKYVLFLVELRPNTGHGLLIHEVSRSHTHNDASQSVGLLWTSDRLAAETSTWQHKTLTTDKHPYCRWDSNPQSLQPSGRRLTPYSARLLGSAVNRYRGLKLLRRETKNEWNSTSIPLVRLHSLDRDRFTFYAVVIRLQWNNGRGTKTCRSNGS